MRTKRALVRQAANIHLHAPTKSDWKLRMRIMLTCR